MRRRRSGWRRHRASVACGLFRWGALGPALLALSGLGPVLAGVTAPVPVHFAVTFLGAGIGLIVLSRRIAHEPSWDGLTEYALATGIAILVVIPIHSALALPQARRCTRGGACSTGRRSRCG